MTLDIDDIKVVAHFGVLLCNITQYVKMMSFAWKHRYN